MSKNLTKQTDALLYLFVGPFAMLYIFPEFFLKIERMIFPDKVSPYASGLSGAVLMVAGGVLAIWCGVVLLSRKGGTVSMFSSPDNIVKNGPFKYVRHPMMWSINMVLAGEILFYFSPFLCIWFIVWLRLAHLYISRHEEPRLIKQFGVHYEQYCKQTPRWFPKFRSQTEEKTSTSYRVR